MQQKLNVCKKTDMADFSESRRTDGQYVKPETKILLEIAY
jgi:hypothetical protein